MPSIITITSFQFQFFFLVSLSYISLFKIQIVRQLHLQTIHYIFPKNPMSDNYHIPIEDLMAIEVQINTKGALEELVKTYQYDEAKDLTLNVKELAEQVVKFLKLEGRGKSAFLEYCVEKNIPIEVNFKPLKAEQLYNMIEEWLSLHTESSTIIEKLYSNNHRNILFKRVLFEQRETIDDYFKTLSDSSMLRGVDLYQLLVDILSPYHLYEFQTDAQTFFEKVNSLNSFLAVVNRFIHSQKRISVGINSSDIEYVRRFEFDRLIQFWEGENSELILLSERRKNHLDKATQTVQIGVASCPVQTDKLSFSLQEIINETINALNKLTPVNENVKELQAIERIHSFLRKEKISHLQRHSQHDQQIEKIEKVSQKTQKKASTSSDFNFFTNDKNQNGILSSLIDHFNENQTLGSIDQDPAIETSLHPQNKKSPGKNKKLSQTLRSIYNLYFVTNFGTGQLIRCLSDIGVRQKDAERSVDRLIISKSMLERHYIYFPEFQAVFEELMTLDADLTIEVLDQFLKMKLETATAFTSPSRQYRYFDRNFDPIGRYL